MTDSGRKGENAYTANRPSTSGFLPRHGLPPRQFDALVAGEGGSTTIAHLWDVERSRRLVLLRLLAVIARDRTGTTGPLEGIDQVWDVLSSAERCSRAVTDDLLLLPQTGQWLRQTLLRLQEVGQPSPTDPPLWVDVGQFHLIAAAAAVRTGVAFSLRLPARSGQLWLPSLGSAALPGPSDSWQPVEASFDGRCLVLGDGHNSLRVAAPLLQETPGWQPAPVLAVELPNGPHQILLSDTGPYRIQQSLAPADPEASAQESADRWTVLLRRALPLLARADPQAMEDVAACLRSIEPLPAPGLFRWRSATMGDSMGGMAIAAPADPQPAADAQLAAVLVHEIQHSKLSALLHMYVLHNPDARARFYAPWRDDPRPLRGMLHGTYAFAAVARFWRGYMLSGCAPHDEAALAAFEFAVRRIQLQRALVQLRTDSELTALGHRMVDQLTYTSDRWMQEDIAQDYVQEAAERAVEDHAVSWRLHHLVPAADLVHDLAQAWSQGTADGGRSRWDWTTGRSYPAPRLVPDSTARELDARAVLERMLLLGDAAGGVPARDDVVNVVPGTSTADLLLLTGEASAARRLYVAQIATPDPKLDSGTASAWAGLRLALKAEGTHAAAAQALTSMPELVRSVYEVLAADGRASDPVAVGEWVGSRAVSAA